MTKSREYWLKKRPYRMDTDCGLIYWWKRIDEEETECCIPSDVADLLAGYEYPAGFPYWYESDAMADLEYAVYLYERGLKPTWWRNISWGFSCAWREIFGGRVFP